MTPASRLVAPADDQTVPPVVLLADDDRLILATIGQGLRSAGFSTIEADSGRAALKLCAEKTPDIAIIDYDMPDMNGLEVAQAMRATCDIPVIFLSAYGDESIVEAAVETGAMAYVLKPIDPSKLIPMIRTTLKRFAEYVALRGESQQLNSALQGTRATSIVVGLLMARMQVSEKQAYNYLRQYCRANNRKVSDVAEDILSATDKLNSTLNDIHAGSRSSPLPIQQSKSGA